MSTELRNDEERANEELRLRDLFEPMTRGDERAWTAFIDVHMPRLKGMVRSQLQKTNLRPRRDSEEVCQSVLADLSAGVRNGKIHLDSKAQLFALLARMVRHKLVKYRKQDGAARRDRRRLIDAPVEELELASHEDDPARSAEASELYAIFQVAMSPEDIRLIEALAAKENWGDVGAEVGQSGDAVRKHATRLVERFKEMLERD